jgi:hypothetical protein
VHRPQVTALPSDTIADEKTSGFRAASQFVTLSTVCDDEGQTQPMRERKISRPRSRGLERRDQNLTRKPAVGAMFWVAKNPFASPP